MNYQQTIDYLYTLLPVFHRQGAKAFKADLTNTIKLCEYLGNPQEKFKTIHIAGTNGKGSTSHYTAAILQSAGYKTGLYTSPHLKDYTERFRINGISIKKAKIVDFVKKHQKFIEELKPSFFELSVAIAFDYFAQEKVDVAVIEVGLGGRLDSTNIIQPILSIITNIGFDHTDILGDTLPKIAIEKAGIIKENTPVVISERSNETDFVFDNKATELNAAIYFATDYYEMISKGFNKEAKLLVDVYQKNEEEKKILKYENLASELTGNYQLKNLGGVLQAVDILRTKGFIISTEDLSRGIGQVVTLTGLKGRWQIYYKKPLTICDTGHNEHGIRNVLAQVEMLEAKQKHFILGFVKDKDVEAILKLFPKDAQYYFCEIDSPRAMPAENLVKIAQSLHLSAQVILKVNDALKFVRKLANPDDFIYIGGSTYLVAELDRL